MKRCHVFVLSMALGLLYGCNTGSENSGSRSEEGQNLSSQANNQNEQNSEGKEFLEKAAHGGVLEVRLGELAQQKASQQEVKDFGQRMATDHGKANQELKNLASQKDITLPQSLSDEGQRHVDKLSDLSGQEFDKEYMDMMVKEHEKDIDTFEEAAEDIDDPAIQGFASKTLPTLKEHHQLAQQINQRVQN